MGSLPMNLDFDADQPWAGVEVIRLAQRFLITGGLGKRMPSKDGAWGGASYGAFRSGTCKNGHRDV